MKRKVWTSFGAVVGASLVIAALAGCGGDDGDAGTTETTAVAASTTIAATPSTSTSGSTAFPLTVHNSLGDVEVVAAPERIVAVGSAELDVLLALGVTPVGYGTYDDKLLPYQEGALPGAATPEVFSIADGLPLETIARLEPDLIVSLGWTDETNYPDLLKIAPVAAYVEDPWGDDWQTQTQQIAGALGRADDGEALITEVEDRIAASAAAHPEFDGATVSFVSATNESVCAVDLPSSPVLVFLRELGFAPALENPASAYCAELSFEQLEGIDADVVLIFGDEGARTQLEANPLYQQLEAVQAGAVVWLDDTQANAVNSPTPLAIPFFLDEVEAAMATALA